MVAPGVAATESERGAAFYRHGGGSGDHAPGEEFEDAAGDHGRTEVGVGSAQGERALTEFIEAAGVKNGIGSNWRRE